ncbi:FecR family protein [Arcicella rosea]|uniref:FecR family protein n=1 Tax=Arcicella rosea TaxID=502909 RepID=A0A841ETP0_9BACT|nr:FecR family protein [Arcicella rosea]MBB6004759.1 hypothetical protein [Arcicella rosea]
MNQYDFDKLLEKYLEGTCTKEEEAIIREWSDNMLKHSELRLNSNEKSNIEQQLWARIQQSLFPKNKTVLRFKWTAVAVAASLIIGIFGIFYYQKTTAYSHSFTESIASNLGVIEVKNTSNKPQKIKLEDGSEIVLKAESSISYPEHFNDKTRSVYLKGEAFFKVKRNPSKPFIVHTRDLVTEVLGTSFTIKSYDDSKAIEVLVATGRVSVYENSEDNVTHKNGVILTPNQKIVFDKETKKLIPSLVENPVIVNIPATTLDFIFEETPLTEVLERLKEAYQIEFVVENHELNKCVFTADLNEISLHNQLDLICKSVNATYEQRGTVIFINGTGCQ